MNHLASALEDVETLLRLLSLALLVFLFVRALPTTEQPPIRSAQWLLTRVVVTSLILLGLVSALNYIVNPLGIYSSHFFDPIVLHSRAEKMRLYRTVQPSPEIVVLGASTSFTMSPAYIRERTGRPAFNASLQGGVPGDYLAFLHYMASLGKLPKLLIVPLAVELMRPNMPTGFEPHNPLEPHLMERTDEILGGVRRLVTLEQTRASIRLLIAEARGRPPSQYRFDADGWGHFRESDAPLEKIVDFYMATKDWGPELFGFRDLDNAQIGYFHRFLTLAQRLGVKVIVYVPPLYPRALAFYERETNFPALRTKLLGQLDSWRGQGLIAAVHDFAHVESFGGRASEFHDLAHPTEAASRRMLDLMLPPRARS